MNRLLAFLLFCLLALPPGRAQVLRVPKDKVGTPILFGSRLVDVSESGGKVFAPGQRNARPVLSHFCLADSALVLMPEQEGRHRR